MTTNSRIYCNYRQKVVKTRSDVNIESIFLRHVFCAQTQTFCLLISHSLPFVQIWDKNVKNCFAIKSSAILQLIHKQRYEKCLNFLTLFCS